MVDPLADALPAALIGADLSPPRIPILSNVTGTWLRSEEAVDPAYWGRQLRLPVRFVECVGELLAAGDRVLLEVGPGRTLAQLVRKHPSWSPDHLVVASLPYAPDSGRGEPQTMLDQLGRLWSAGVEPRWDALHAGERRRRVALPSYPFERARHWIDPADDRPAQPVAWDAQLPGTSDRQARPDIETRFVAAERDAEAEVVAVFEALLGTTGVGVHDDFFDLGGDSLLGTELASRLHDALGVSVPLRAVFERPTATAIAELANRIRAEGQEATLHGLGSAGRNDVWFDGGIDRETAKRLPMDVDEVLLTGATGFLGSYVLRELLDQTSSVVHCVVRCANADAGLERVLSGLRAYGLIDDADVTRVRAVPGDVSAARLGLGPDDFDRLADAVGAAYHISARVSFLEPYASLRLTNVNGTREILRFACEGRPKIVHHVSSIAAFDCDAFADLAVASEDEDMSRASGFRGAYDESKWVAEQVVEVARESGVPVTVFRPGNIAGDSRTGAAPPGQFITAVVRGCIQLGAVPDTDAFVDIEPVDYVSKALVYIGRRDEARGKTFHLVNPSAVRWSEIAEELRSAGYPLRPLPFEDWREALRTESHEENPLRPFLPMLTDRTLFTGRRYRADRAAAALAGSPIECPPVDSVLISTYLGHLCATGELPPPPAPAGGASTATCAG
jgi:phthiocerol/phenolphthiocerol synthesis type-I polyketide synthase E